MSPELDTAIFVVGVGIPMLLAYGYGNAFFSGWRSLSTRYRERSAFALAAGLRGQIARFGGKWAASEYPHSVTIAVDGLGLHLGQRGILRIGHPPILIPWSSIDAVGPVKWFIRTFDTYRVDGRYTVGFPSDSAGALLIAPYVERRSVEVRNDH